MSMSNQLDINSSQNLGMLSTFREPGLATAGHRDQGYFAFTSFGVHFELSASEATLLQEALTYLPLESKGCANVFVGPRYSLVRSSAVSQPDKTSHRLYRDGRRLFTCGDQRELLERFGSIVSLYVAEASLNRTFVHAGVVGWGRSAILIPGRSFSGKTSLVAALVRAGQPTILTNLRWSINEGWSIPTLGHYKYGRTLLTARPDAWSKRSEALQEKGPCPSGWSSSAATSQARGGLPAGSHRESDC
jgi:hypothetical protein